MRMLMIGGTGPTGTFTVEGLLQRGHEVTVLHGGQHEVEFSEPVEHIHTDAHFVETLESALAGRRFDVVIATYGRLRAVVEVIKGKTDRLIAVGAPGNAGVGDPRWGPLGVPANVTEDAPGAGEHDSRFMQLIRRSQELAFEAHDAGFYTTTYLRYPLIYGPRSPANPDWSLVRRALDGRDRVIASIGIRGSMYAENAAHALLLAVDQPEAAAGQSYNLRDDRLYTQVQMARHIGALLGREWEVVEVPPVVAARVYRTMGVGGVLAVVDTTKVRRELGYCDVVEPHEGIRRAVEWLVVNQPERGGEVEAQLGDPFDYSVEDAVIERYTAGLAHALELVEPEERIAHMYRHPTEPGQTWRADARSQR